MAIVEYIELSALQSQIGERIGTLEQWVRVEFESCRVSGGHYYLNLIEKSRSGEISAKASGRIWRQRAAIVAEFARATGKTLEAGMSVVVLASVEYHPVYGLSLVIEDIDPAFTLGLREQERLRTIERLTGEGMIEMQKGLGLPFLPSKIAVISSGDAAGFGDFKKHLDTNPYGYKFDFTIFQALMQGEKSPSSIISAIDSVEEEGSFDVAVILRGGGADSDLFGYDDYMLCRRVAVCGIPVLSAVGHQRDYHVLDMVSYESFKTPTAVADFFIQWFLDVEAEVTDVAAKIFDAARDRLDDADRMVRERASSIAFAILSVLGRLDAGVSALDASIRSCDPRNLLSQGYVLAMDGNGRILKNASSGSVGDNVSVRFSDGVWDCGIKSINLYKNQQDDK